MSRGHPIYGVAEGEEPEFVHRLSGVSGRAYCGKAIMILPGGGERSKRLVCRRCAAIDESRRAGLPSYDEAMES